MYSLNFANTEHARECVLDGLLASTGRLFLNGGAGKPTLWFSSYDRALAETVGEILGIKSQVSLYEAPGRSPLHILQTVASDSLTKAYERWYTRYGVKSMPESPLGGIALYFWHMASGSVMSDGVYLTTDGYTSHGYKRAAYALSTQLGQVAEATDYNFIRIPDKSTFFDKIRPYGELPAHKVSSDFGNAALIGVSGKARHGKDTYGELLRAHTGARPVSRVALADPLKEETSALIADQHVAFSESPYEWVSKFRESRAAMDDPDVKEQYRGLNVWWGTEFRRMMFSQLYWVKRFEHHARQLLVDQSVLVCTDVRFPNEVELIRGMGGKVVRVFRPDTPATSTHPSETSLDDYTDWDSYIVNDGTKEDYGKKVGESWMQLSGVPA